MKCASLTLAALLLLAPLCSAQANEDIAQVLAVPVYAPDVADLPPPATGNSAAQAVPVYAPDVADLPPPVAANAPAQPVTMNASSVLFIGPAPEPETTASITISPDTATPRLLPPKLTLSGIIR